jgi:hypothetical protein
MEFGLVSCSPFAASLKLNSSSFVISDGLMFCICTTLTGETASCHLVNTPPAGSVKNQRLDNLLAFRAAKSAREIDDEADQQNQAQPAAADDRTTKVKSTAAKQEKQDNRE